MLRWLTTYLAFLGLLLGLFIVGTWVAAPYLIEQFAPGMAQSQNLDDFTIEINKLDLDRALIDSIGFATKTLNGNLNINIGNSVVDFDITTATASSIRIADARIEYFPSPGDSDESNDATQIPVIPLTELIIERIDLTVHSERGPTHLAGRLEITQVKPGQFNLNFRGPLYTLSGLLTTSPLTLELALNENTDDVFATLDYQAEHDITQIDADLKPLLKWFRTTSWLPLPDLPQDIALEQGRLNINIQHPETPGKTRASGLLELTQFGYESQRIDAILPFILAHANQGIELELTNHAQVHIQEPDSHAIDLRFEPHYQVHASFNEDNELTTALGKGRARANITLPQTILDAAVKNWQLGHWTAGQPLPDTVRIDLHDLTSSSLPPTVPPVALHGKWQLTNDVVKGNGTARIGDAIPVQWRSHHRLPSWTTVLNASLNQPTAVLWPAVQPMLGSELQPVNVYEGQTNATAQLHWSPESDVLAQGKLTAHSVSAKIDNLDLSQADITISVDDLLTPRGHFLISVPQTTLGNGLQTGAFNTSGDFGRDYAEVTKATLDLYSGQLSMQPTRLFLNETTNNLEVDVRNLDIGTIISDFGPTYIEVSGDITGSLPITLDQSGLTIHDAIVSSDGPGIVRYQPALGTDNDQNIALKALDNFHYKHFKANLDYAANGDYAIKIRFNGNNPDLYEGHPIEFNLNLDGNLPGFLRASILSGDLAGEAMKTLKKRDSQPTQ